MAVGRFLVVRFPATAFAVLLFGRSLRLRFVVIGTASIRAVGSDCREIEGTPICNSGLKYYV